MVVIHWFMSIVLVVTIAPSLWAQSAQVEKDYDKVRVSLLTLGSFDRLYSGAGHSVLRINDQNSGDDRVYNWGIFNFDSENFALKFYKETLMYKLVIKKSDWYINIYKQQGQRGLEEREILLNPHQKKILLSKVKWWSRKENRLYRYHIFKKNCATVIRDLIDESMGGDLKKKTESVKGEYSVRQYWRQYFSSFPFPSLGADLLFNSEVDVPLNGWEQMYLPERLQHHLADQGLLGSSKIIIDRPFRQPEGINPYVLVSIILGAPLVLGWLLFRSTKFRKLGIATIGLGTVVWGLITTAFGLLIPLTTILSERTYFYFSANSWLFWPVDLVLVICGALYWLRGKPIPEKSRFVKGLRWAARLHVVGGGIFGVLWLFGVIEQNIVSEILTIAPLTLCYWLSTLRLVETKPVGSAGGKQPKLQKSA